MRFRRRGLFCVALTLLACSPSPRVGAGARVAEEFLLVSDDSTAWVRASADTVVVRRAPLLLATLADRLIEIYVAEESFDFEEATFLVSRVFRRDLVSGDSALVFADSSVLREAMRFVREHPTAERLEDEDTPPDGARSLESSVTPLGVIGSTIGLEIHVDRTIGELGTHDTYRATVDIASGRRLSLAQVISPQAAATALVVAHQRFAAAIVLASRRDGPVGKAASLALKSLMVDSLSFSLAREGDSLAAIFLAHDEQVIDEARDTHRFSLEPIPLAAPAWWRAARAPLPELHSDSVSHFEVGSFTLDVRYDDEDVASVVTRSGRGTRSVARMRGPLRRVIAVGDSVIKPRGQWRRALENAFSESGYYSDQVRAASLRSRARPTAARQAAL